MGILLSPHYNKGVHGRLQGGRGVLAPRGSRKHRSVAPGTYMMAQKVGNWLESETCFVAPFRWIGATRMWPSWGQGVAEMEPRRALNHGPTGVHAMSRAVGYSQSRRRTTPPGRR